MAHRGTLVVANWKMNGTLDYVHELVATVNKELPQDNSANIIICPPFVYLSELAKIVAPKVIKIGAQNVSAHANGAYTGEISATMLHELGCHYVIVGHSERRQLYGETCEQVAEKFIAVQTSNMTPILCVGELLAERDAGNTQAVINKQLDSVIHNAGIATFENAIIAYEPVWAIGTGKSATPEQAQEIHEFIRHYLAKYDQELSDRVKILYGGSVNADNAEGLFRMADIDGALVGGASLSVNDFITICQVAR